ncbi:hypothetical protein K502DRAFT_323578 [Neoconidiobolus thromboides FSU 785]|nr:hypothetical protein K502DRAFT_323578 [Neoconidiobolus thromboides FSU 785]
MEFGLSQDIVPEIPGQTLGRDFEKELRGEVGSLFNIKPERFPGAQPVSFTLEHLQELKETDYFVCEKSDGVRCLLFTRINPKTKRPETFLIDRKNKYRYLHDIHIPLPNCENNGPFQDKTIIDGELVYDIEKDGKRVLKYLAFDLLSFQGKVLIQRGLEKRQGYLRTNVVKPFLKRATQLNVLDKLTIIIEAKVMELSYGMIKILKEQVPTLKHKSDGLIFTSVNAPYTLGTCSTMLKWKPPNENSVDFKLHIEVQSPSTPPRFLLSIWKGGSEYQQVDEMGVSDSELKFFKTHFGSDFKKRMEGKIVEVIYDPDNCPPCKWKFMRFRDDKEHANHSSVLDKILKSISDNVDEEKLNEEHFDIRARWKERDGKKEKETTTC